LSTNIKLVLAHAQVQFHARMRLCKILGQVVTHFVTFETRL